MLYQYSGNRSVATGRRVGDFKKFVRTIKQKLTEYIEAKNKAREIGWQAEAQRYLDYSLVQIEGYESLLILKRSLAHFAGTLRSRGNWVASYFFSDQTIKDYASYIGGPGSDLKQQLDTIVALINPYSAIYILDEVRYAEFHHRVYGPYTRSAFHLIEIMSEASLQVLNEILKDEKLQTVFCQEYREAARLVGETQTTPEQILTLFEENYPKGYEAHTNKLVL